MGICCVERLPELFNRRVGATDVGWKIERMVRIEQGKSLGELCRGLPTSDKTTVG